MYRRPVRKAKAPPGLPKPVCGTQKQDEAKKPQDDGDDENEENQVQCSQENQIPIVSQSRFSSQRHNIVRATQEEQFRGKNFFEICLISCKVKISDIGEFISQQLASSYCY